MNLLKMLSYRLAGSLRAFQGKGLGEGLMEFGRKIWGVFYQHGEYVIVAKVISSQTLLLDRKPELEIHQNTTREEITTLSSISDPFDMMRFYEMFERGSICFSAFQNDQIVGYGWVSQEVERRGVNRVQPPLRPGDACTHDVFVSPLHRGQGIGQALISRRVRFLYEHGYKRAVGAVHKGNASSLKLNGKAGYVQIGEMSHIRILFWDSFTFNIMDA
jgi:GNAT superfamily N-acetyltransferase